MFWLMAFRFCCTLTPLRMRVEGVMEDHKTPCIYASLSFTCIPLYFILTSEHISSSRKLWGSKYISTCLFNWWSCILYLFLVDLRAAAYTHIRKYTEAIQDCLRSIEIDPNYCKAYSRLGLAYHAQGNYRDAIDIFRKGW